MINATNKLYLANLHSNCAQICYHYAFSHPIKLSGDETDAHAFCLITAVRLFIFMKKHGILNRELAGIFAKLGHTDQIVIADCGLPIPNGVTCIDLAYALGKPSFTEVLAAVLADVAVESSVCAHEITRHNTALWQHLEGLALNTSQVSHEAFKQQTAHAKVIIRTGEATPYANIILQSGVIF